MTELSVQTQTKRYPVYITPGALAQTGSIVAAQGTGRNTVVVTDHQVAEYFLERVVQSLKNAGFTCDSAVIPAGEKSKTPEQLARLYASFHKAGLTRSDSVVALGGGVVGDLAGFAAATWLRGVSLVQVPTSLLAQVDSSVGGKTGLDLPQGKNLVGAFYQPNAVIIDPLVLETLPGPYRADGMAEIIKYGFIADRTLLERIETKNCDQSWMIERCLRIKIHFIEKDEKDSGERMLLNFGHTVGHSIEKLTGFTRYSHGQAVAIGMVLAARMGEIMNRTKPGTTHRLVRILTEYGLPISTNLPVPELIDALRSDKKKLGRHIHFVLLHQPGEAFLHPMTPEEIQPVLEVASHD
jgi:3-dehydroquinate synthase